MSMGFWQWFERLYLMKGTNPVYIPRRSDVIRRKRLRRRFEGSRRRK